MNNLFYVALMWFSTIIGGAINYLYHPLMIQYLSIHEFAEFESLVGVFNILWVLTTGVSLFLVKEIAKNSKNLVMVKSIFRFSNVFLLVFGCTAYLVFALFSPFIARFLKFDSVYPVLLTGLIIIFSFQWTVVWAVLQGLKRFRFIAFGWILSSIFRLLFGVIFVFFGYKLYGAIGWFIIAGAFVFFLNFFYTWNILKNYETIDTIDTLKKDFKKDSVHIFHFFLLAFFLAILMNMDVIFAKNLFDSNAAGIYAGLSVLAKFLIFLWWAIETVYYPQIMEHRKEEVPRHFLINSFFMLLILTISALVFHYFFGGMILNLMKKWLGEFVDIFLFILIFCGLYTFISLYSKVLIGWKVYAINYVLWAFLAILIALLLFLWNMDMRTFIFLFIGFSFVIALLCGAMVYITILKDRKPRAIEVEDFM